MVIRFNPAHVTICEFLDRELRINLSSGKCIVATGSNQSMDELDGYARGQRNSDDGWVYLDYRNYTSLNLIDSVNFTEDSQQIKGA